MIKPTVQIGNPVVRTKASPIAIKDIRSPKVKNTIRDLIDSMRKYELVGMAAPQIGEGVRIFVTEIRTTINRKDVKPDELRVFINPVLSGISKTQTILMEGCGSLANARLFGPVKRPSRVTVTAFDQNGQKFTLKTTGLLAKVVQHELDHLNGIICIDRFTDFKKVMDREEYRKSKNNVRQKTRKPR